MNWSPPSYFKSDGFRNKSAPGLAASLWLILMLVIGIMVFLQPNKASVTDYYHVASVHWKSRANLYDDGHVGMNYLPHFAIIFSLFDALPLTAGNILWRIFEIALLATGLWRMVKQMFGDDAPHLFLWITILALPLSAAAVRNGQANTLLGGLMLHVAASLAAKKWGSAACFIALAIVAKPVAVVLVLLAPFVYRKLWLPLAISLAGLVVFPFFFANPGYVIREYEAFVSNLGNCAAVTEYEYADITGFLWPLHIQLPVPVSQIIRSSAGFATLCLWWFGAHRMREPLRAFWLLTLSAAYLMLFNPMTESNSYVIFAPVLAIWAVFFLHRSSSSPRGWIITFLPLSMGLLPNILRPWFGNRFAMAYHPVMTILFLAVLITWIWGEKAPLPPGSGEVAES